MARKELTSISKSVWFSGKTEKPLITHINRIDNFSDYVKRLIMEDIERKKELEEKLSGSDLAPEIIEALIKRL